MRIYEEVHKGAALRSLEDFTEELGDHRQMKNRMRKPGAIFCLVCGIVLAGCGGPAHAGTVYVSATNGNDASSGSSWDQAKATIQAGVDAATTGDTVLVSDGTYNTGGRVPPGQVLCQARVVIDKAVRVSSVNGPSNTFIVGEGPCGDTAVRCVWMTNNTCLDGFTLTNGYTSVLTGGDDEHGGGLYATDNSSAIMSNCLIQACAANKYGGGAFKGRLHNSTLSGNSAQYGGGVYWGTLNNCTLSCNFAQCGGGAYDGTLKNCTVSRNTAEYGGGAFDASLQSCILSGNSATNADNLADGGGACYGTLNNCTVSSNSAQFGGGTFDGRLNNCTLSGNSAQCGGGAFDGIIDNCTLLGNSAEYGGGACDGTLNNCTLSGNLAQYGGGASDYTAYDYRYCMLNNCTLYGNATGGVYNVTARNTIIYGNTAYEMSESIASFCHTNDPLFVDASVGNLRLQSNSPCINTGFNAYAPTNESPLDLAGNPRISQGIIDKGAYEYQGVDLFNLYAFSGTHGSIIPSGVIRTNQGSDVVFSMLPVAYYHVALVITNGTSVGAVTNITWQNVSAPGTITVSFAATTAALGTPHWWLAQYNWTQNCDAVEAADQDADGLFTWQEYAAGTCPTNANSDGDQYDDGVEVRAGADPLRDDSQTYAALLSHPDSFGLYTSNSVMDLSFGQAILNVVSNNIQVQLRMQATYALEGNDWTNLGEAVEWVCPLNTNKQFFRFLGAPGD